MALGLPEYIQIILDEPFLNINEPELFSVRRDFDLKFYQSPFFHYKKQDRK